MTATRYQIGVPPQQFDVLKLNEDGTVDLGKDGELIIAGSIFTIDPQPGACVLNESVSEAPVEAPKSKKSK